MLGRHRPLVRSRDRIGLRLASCQFEQQQLQQNGHLIYHLNFVRRVRRVSD